MTGGLRGTRAGCAALLLAALSACATSAPVTAPGVITRTETLQGAPAGAAAMRIVYGSTTPDGKAIDVSALVIVPTSVPPPPEGRPVVAWLHPTTGVADACAPSQVPNPFGQIQGLGLFLARGDIVVATDYPGLGMPGPHPYLVGASEARSAIDSVRAVQHLPDAHAGKRYAVWGHSQGGHAALFTAGLAAGYAPELQLVGAAAAAPVTDIPALLQQPGDDPLWGPLLSYTVWSWSKVYGLKAAEILPPDAEATVTRAAAECLLNKEQLDQITADAAPLNGQPVTPNAQWQATMVSNEPQPWNTGVPAFLAQGALDPVIDPQSTKAFAQRLCAAGVPVRFVSLSRGDHYTAGVRSAGAAAAWISDRFAGRPPRDDCSGAGLR